MKSFIFISNFFHIIDAVLVHIMYRWTHLLWLDLQHFWLKNQMGLFTPMQD